MITFAHQLGFKLQNLLFFYLPCYPIKWNPTYTEIWIEPKKRLLPWASFIVFLPINFMLYGFSFVDFTYIHPRSDFSAVRIVIFFCTSTFLLICCFVMQMVLRNLELYISTYNQFLKLERNLISLYCGKKGSLCAPTNTAAFLLVMTAGSGIIPWFAVAPTIFGDCDAMYYILEQYVLDDPMYRSISQLILERLLRMTVLVPFLLEKYSYSYCIFVSSISSGRQYCRHFAYYGN